MKRPNVLYIMCDQFRWDCIAALGNPYVRTPNLDRLAARGLSFSRAYSTCPVCVPARYTLRTGREPWHTGCYANEVPAPMDRQAGNMEDRCGPYLPRVMRSPARAMILVRGLWMPSNMDSMRPGPNSTLRGSPVDTTGSPSFPV